MNKAGSWFCIWRRLFDIDESWTEIEDPNVRSRFSHMITQAFGITEQTKLCSAVRRHIRIAMLTRLRRNIHDIAKIVLDHLRQDGAHQLHHAAQVRLHHSVPTIFGNLVYGLRNGEPRV